MNHEINYISQFEILMNYGYGCVCNVLNIIFLMFEYIDVTHFVLFQWLDNAATVPHTVSISV